MSFYAYTAPLYPHCELALERPFRSQIFIYLAITHTNKNIFMRKSQSANQGEFRLCLEYVIGFNGETDIFLESSLLVYCG
jgi:hypothetical protein